MPDWKSIVRSRPGGRALPDDVADEIAEHAAELYRTLCAAGRSAEESIALVEAEMAQLEHVARAARRVRQHPPAVPEPSAGPRRWPVTFIKDVVHGIRLLASRPAFTAAAVLTLALGIGANTAIFSVVYSLLLAPLPFPEPDRLVMMWESSLDNREDRWIVSAPNWRDWRASSTSFERIAIWEELMFNVSGGVEPEQVAGLRVSASAFPMLGVLPQLGRTFTDDEDHSGARVVVISDALWRRRFGASPAMAGQSLRVNGVPYEVIGVMPPGFPFFQQRFHLWVPIAFNANDESRSAHSFFAAGRLKPGLSFENARNEVEELGRRLEAQHHEGDGATITRMSEFGVAQLRPTLQALLGAVAFLLLIACVNVANLLLAQATARQREFSIRAALGASRGRLAAQLLAEGLLLAFAGGAAGILVAWTGTAALTRSLPLSISFAPFRGSGTIVLHAPVLLFTCVVAILTGVLFSLAPMAGITRVDAGAALRSSGDRGGTASSTILRTVLVGTELALAVIVLAAAGLMIKSVARLASVNPGFEPRGVLLLSMALPQEDFYGPPVRTTFCDDVRREVGPLPGVQRVSAMSHIPFEGNAGRALDIEGRSSPSPGESYSANYRLTCPGYFSTLGIPILRGRDFTPADSTTGPTVAIINEEAAKRYWADADPVGQRVRFGSSSAWMTIVGVVGNVRHFGLDNPARREIYRPYSQAAWPTMTVTVKTATEPMMLANAVQRALRRIDPEQPVTRIRTMENVVASSMGGRRFPMQLLGLFSIVALALSSIGVYGVVSYVVSQRMREIGIRVALGARRQQVMRLVVGRSLVPIAIGIAAGSGGAVFAGRLLGSLLYQVRPFDPMVLGSIVAILGCAAVMASWIPARRAATVDPIVVLRQQ